MDLREGTQHRRHRVIARPRNPLRSRDRLLIVPTYTLNYVGQPIPVVMAVKQIAFDGIFVVVLGVIVAVVSRKQTR